MFNLIVDLFISLCLVICLASFVKTYGDKAKEAMDALLTHAQFGGVTDGHALVFKHYRLAYLFWSLLFIIAMLCLFKDTSAAFHYLK